VRIEVREPHARLRQRVHVRRPDLAAVGAQVGEPMSSATIMTMFGFFTCCACAAGETAEQRGDQTGDQGEGCCFMCSPAVPASRRSIGSNLRFKHSTSATGADGPAAGQKPAAGAANRHRSVPRRSKSISTSAPGSMKSSWSSPVQSGWCRSP